MRLHSRCKPALPILALLLAGCLSGTSTETGNAEPPSGHLLFGEVRLEDGRPAQGALVNINSGLLSMASGRPAWIVLAFTHVDSSGHFGCSAPGNRDFYVEVLENPSGPQSSGHAQIFFRHYPKGTVGPQDAGILVMVRSGALRGRVIDKSGAAARGSALWIGMTGVTAMVPLQAPGDSTGMPFLLQNLPPGQSELVLIDSTRKDSSGVRAVSIARTMVVPDSLTDVPSISYGP